MSTTTIYEMSYHSYFDVILHVFKCLIIDDMRWLSPMTHCHTVTHTVTRCEYHVSVLYFVVRLVICTAFYIVSRFDVTNDRLFVCINWNQHSLKIPNPVSSTSYTEEWSYLLWVLHHSCTPARLLLDMCSLFDWTKEQSHIAILWNHFCAAINILPVLICRHYIQVFINFISRRIIIFMQLHSATAAAVGNIQEAWCWIPNQ